MKLSYSPVIRRLSESASCPWEGAARRHAVKIAAAQRAAIWRGFKGGPSQGDDFGGVGRPSEVLGPDIP